MKDCKVVSVDHLCDLVVRVPGYRSRGPDLISSSSSLEDREYTVVGIHHACGLNHRVFFFKLSLCLTSQALCLEEVYEEEDV
jgi:hypothetical protein